MIFELDCGGWGLRGKRMDGWMDFYNELTECLSFSTVVKCKYGCSFNFLLLQRQIKMRGGASAVFLSSVVNVSTLPTFCLHDAPQFSPAHRWVSWC